MDQLILNIKNKSKIPFLKELLKRMEFVEIVEPEKKSSTVKKSQVPKGLTQAVKETKLIKAGKLKGIQARDLLNEL